MKVLTNKRVRLASPYHSICSHNSAPPLRISREETTFRKSKRIRRATSHFGELASEVEVDDEIGLQVPSYSASFQPPQLPDNRPMIESSVQLCPPEENNSNSDYDEYTEQEYEVDISGHQLRHEDLYLLEQLMS